MSLDLREGEELTIISTFEGRPLSEALIRVETTSGFVVDGGRTDAQGRRLFSGLSPGRYQIHARSPDRALRAAATVTLPGTSSLELILRSEPATP